MTKTIFTQEFIIESVSTANVVSGYCTILASETIHADGITGMIYFEARGRMTSQKEHVLTIELAHDQALYKNKTYTLPFSFDLPADSIESYSCKNVSFSYSCDIILAINENDSSTIERSAFAKIKAVVSSKNEIKTTHYFNFENKNRPYEVFEIKEKFYLQTNLFISLIFILIFGAIYSYYIPDFNTLYIVLGVILVFLLVFVSNQFIKGALGKVSLETLQNDDGFYCKIYKTKKFNLSNQTLYYEIIEEVTDSRGSSTSTAIETIFTSHKKPLTDFRDTSTIQFNYPQESGLQSVNYKDVSIFWRVVLEGNYYGNKMKYSRKFKVDKRNPSV
ncbi:hypothetical protein ES677_01615 [Bizionia gelidisalsuginis]|uniref:DUF2207 domain-containing protein n=1 Tax=Bizionia gelidisalsuginis TaxID=291188 RepID=A0ABY3MEZ0_9FLAO|nr:hypothetical protein [Bizionia gelidisalsuginis]TYC18103.1 hypothetical protein ES677_01615 [Bizionia gelidisalsuginis]